MLPKERVRAAFEHRSTDKVPVHHVGFSSEVATAIIGREAYVGGGIQQWREATAHWNGPDAHAAIPGAVLSRCRGLGSGGGQ